MINFFLGFGVGSILSMFCLCLLQAASKLDECIGCNVRDCEKCKWKDLINKENGGNER